MKRYCRQVDKVPKRTRLPFLYRSMWIFRSSWYNQSRRTRHHLQHRLIVFFLLLLLFLNHFLLSKAGSSQNGLHYHSASCYRSQWIALTKWRLGLGVCWKYNLSGIWFGNASWASSDGVRWNYCSLRQSSLSWRLRWHGFCRQWWCLAVRCVVDWWWGEG